MLVLSRKNQECVIIGSPEGLDEVRIKVIGIRGGRVRLGFEAANGVTVDREEVWEQRQAIDRTSLAQDTAKTITDEAVGGRGGDVKPESPQ